MTPLRICLIASSRFPIREPFAGGMEAHTHALARALIARGHEVTLYAGPGTDPSLSARTLEVARFSTGSGERADVSVTPQGWIEEHHAYLALLLELAREAPDRFDVIHNNSLHHLPVAMAAAVRVPMVTTLHTPPVPWLESALRFAPPHSRFVAVSDHVGRSWRHVVSSQTIANGVDTDLWTAGPGGANAVWFGRIVPEKAPHLAIDVARAAGLPLDLAGPVFDDAYFSHQIEPRLGSDVHLLGHLTQRELVAVVGRARVALMTPAWDEPYGLVAAEAMSCGTPVAAFRRGAMSEVVGETGGRLAEPGDVPGLAGAALEAAALDRREVRDSARRRHSVDRMVDEYEALYRATALQGAA